MKTILSFRRILREKRKWIKRQLEARVRVLVILFDATFNKISVIAWQSVSLVEEIGENY